MQHFTPRHEDEGATNKENAISRILSGKAAWNTWAIALGAEKQQLIDEGEWEAERIWSDEHQAIITIGVNKLTRDWLERALTDFSHLTFSSDHIEFLDRNRQAVIPLRENRTLVTFNSDMIDFSGCIFPSDVLFTHSRFKADTNFKEILVEGDASFEDARFERMVAFTKANFEGEAWFNRAEFQGDARFKQAFCAQGIWFNRARFAKKAVFIDMTCCRSAWFHEATFKGRANFEGTHFLSEAIMEDVTFKGRAVFTNAKFDENASFKECTFQSRALFKDVVFQKAALFNRSDFNGYTIFEAAKFKGPANFKAIHTQKGFSLERSEFTTEIPNFRQAFVKEPAEFRDISLLPPPKKQKFSKRVKAVLRGIKHTSRLQRRLAYIDTVSTEWFTNRYSYLENRFTNSRRKPTDEAYYAALRRMAEDTDDLRAQIMFQAGEVRARRHIKDRWKDFPSGTLNLLRGLTDELTSNFGRSLMRPMICWMASFFIFTGLYLAQANNPLAAKCENTKSLSQLNAAQYLSFKNAVGLGWVDKASNTVVKTCLYGKEETKLENKDQARLATLEGEIISANMPTPIKAITPWSMKITAGVQTAVSFLLLALFFISLRNRLAMRS